MGRSLRIVGLVLLAGLVWLLLADSVGWIPRGSADAWVRPLVGSAAALLGLGVVLALLEPLVRSLGQGRCCRCGSRIERGQTYCPDHLQQSVNEYRDRLRREDAHSRSRPV
jgi:hypothetical protein